VLLGFSITLRSAFCWSIACKRVARGTAPPAPCLARTFPCQLRERYVPIRSVGVHRTAISAPTGRALALIRTHTIVHCFVTVTPIHLGWAMPRLVRLAVRKQPW